MPTISQLAGALRDDSNAASLAPAAHLRADGRRRTIAQRGAGAVAILIVIIGLTAAIALAATPASNRRAPTATKPPRYALETGIITVDGKPVAGAKLLIQVWANNDVMDKLKTGQIVPMKVFGPAYSGADGRYAIVVDPAEISATLRSGSATKMTINFDVDIYDGSVAFSWSVPARTCSQGGAADGRYWCGVDTRTPSTLDFELGTTPKVRDNTSGHNWQPLPVMSD